MSVLDVVGDAEPHLFKFWDSEGVINPFHVDPTLYGTKMSLLVGGSGPCISTPKQLDVHFSRVCDNLFIVHKVVRVTVVQLYPGGVQFFALLCLLVHQHIDYVL